MTDGPLMTPDTGVTAYEKVAVLDALTTALSAVPDAVIYPAYNHDDVYVYVADTHEIVEVIGRAQYLNRFVGQGSYPVPAGYGYCKGFDASRLNLWHKAQSPDVRLVCSERSRDLRMAFHNAQRGAA